MKKVNFRSAFTLVELLIVVAILAILSGAAYVGIQRSQARVMNEKVLDDLQAIANALEQFKQDDGEYPIPSPGADKNLNCFFSDTSYAHDCGAADFIQAMVDNNLLTKRYLQEVPTDPRTGSRYVYGVSADGQYFQVAGITFDAAADEWVAQVVGNVAKGYELQSLIRAYNGPNFVFDEEDHLPYSPDHLNITASLDGVDGVVTINGEMAGNGDMAVAGDMIETTPGSIAVVYFSDGSVTVMDSDTRLRILPSSGVGENDEDNIITKVKLKLLKGKIWNKVARLASQSEFNVETTSAIAGVRGTEFGLDADDPNDTKIIVLNGTVVAEKKAQPEPLNADADESFEDFTVLDNSILDENEQGITGDGTFKQYDIPEQDENQTGVSIQLLEDDFNKYYKLPVNNNLRPKFLLIDVPNGVVELEEIKSHPESPSELPPLREVQFFYHNPNKWPYYYEIQDANLDLVVLTEDPDTGFYIEDGKVKFDNGDIVIQNDNTVEQLVLTIVNSGAPNVVVRFSYQDGTVTDFSKPALTFDLNTHLTAADIYNEAFAQQASQGQQQQGQGPTINGPVNDIALGQTMQISATGDCAWEIQTNNAGAIAPAQGSIITYSAIKEVQPHLIRQEVGLRFSDTNIQPVTITCDDGQNPPDQVNFNVTYDYFAISDQPDPPNEAGSGYKYSYHAGVADWTLANQNCLNLDEGGIQLWQLPKIGNNFLGLDIATGDTDDFTTAQEVNYLCENNGNTCANDQQLEGEGAFWLEESSNPGSYHIAIIGNLSLNFSQDGDANQNAYRCIEGL